MVRMINTEIERRRKIGQSISNKFDVESILHLSSRTSQKILKRMWEYNKIKCSNCGWNRTPCDLHHINGRKISDADNHNNLSYLCPNCHRLAHRSLLTTFITLSEQIGDEWKKYYYGFRTLKSKEVITEEKRIREEKRIKNLNKKKNRIVIVLNSDIDFNKFGWGAKLSKKFNISPQKTIVWVKKNMSEFYFENCYSKN